MLPVRFLNAGHNIVDDGLGLLKPGIVGGDDGQVRKPSAHLAHLEPAQTGAVPSAAKHADQPSVPVFLQGGQKTFQRHGVVRVIDEQGEFIRHLHRLDAPFHLRGKKRLLHIRNGNPEMTADGDGSQRVVDAEPARHVDLSVKIHRLPAFRPVCAAGDMEGCAQLSIPIRQLQARGADVAPLAQSVGFQPAGAAFRHLPPVSVVSVHNAHPALLEQKPLAMQIFFKAGMLIRPDMIRLDIRKNAEVKHEALASVLHQRLGGNLHHHRIAALLHHP